MGILPHSRTPRKRNIDRRTTPAVLNATSLAPFEYSPARLSGGVTLTKDMRNSAKGLAACAVLPPLTFAGDTISPWNDRTRIAVCGDPNAPPRKSDVSRCGESASLITRTLTSGSTRQPFIARAPDWGELSRSESRLERPA